MPDMSQFVTPPTDAELERLQKYLRGKLERRLRDRRRSKPLVLNLSLDVRESLRVLKESEGTSRAVIIRDLIEVLMPLLQVTMEIIDRNLYSEDL